MKSYRTSSEDEAMVQALSWLTPAPALVVQVPGAIDVGEREFTAALARSVYEKNVAAGLHRRDNPTRHFCRCSLSYDAAPEVYGGFFDSLFDLSPFTNGFYGLQVVDVSSWLGNPPESAGWAALSHHVQQHPETDFAFIAKTKDAAQMTRLAQDLGTCCGVAVVRIALLSPSPVMLVEALEEALGVEPDALGPDVVQWMEDAVARHPDAVGYDFARNLAMRAKLTRTDPRDMASLRQLFEDAQSQLKSPAERHLGF